MKILDLVKSLAVMYCFAGIFW